MKRLTLTKREVLVMNVLCDIQRGTSVNDISSFLVVLALWCMATGGWAQTDGDRKSIHLPDSTKSDYEEWLRNEPLKVAGRDSSFLQPLPPQKVVEHPHNLAPKHQPVAINIMTPDLRTNMQLAYQSHWLEEQRKEQAGGAMTIGVNPVALIGWVIYKIFPERKSKKQRKREKLQRILDNY